MYILKIFLLIVIIKFSLNLFRLLGTKYIYKKFLFQPPNIYQYAPFVTSLFNSAGTQKIILSSIRTNGLNQASQDYISNSIGKKDSFNALNEIFQRTIGIYKYRMLQSINPFYWIFLPTHISMNFDVILNTPLKLILNLLYWVVSVFATYFLESLIDSLFSTWIF